MEQEVPLNAHSDTPKHKSIPAVHFILRFISAAIKYTVKGKFQFISLMISANSNEESII
jgi:hypothetical protein